MQSRRHQETRKEKLQSAQYMKASMILEQAVEDRSKTICKKRFCYGCLEGISKKYNAKSCSNRRQCKVSNGSVMVDTRQYYTGSILRKINQRKAPTK